MATQVGDVMSTDIVTVTPDSTLDEAVELIRDRAVRRVPVVDGDRPVGIVSIGDLALAKDPKSALADIIDASPNT